MADSQISRVLIPCFVVQLNNQALISATGEIGKVENVPCRDALVDEVLYWCSPIKDEGIFDLSALQFRLALGADAIQPTFDSFLVQRIRDKLTNYTWWVYVLTNNDFKNSCNSCCGDAAVPMPGVNGSFNPIIAPCQTLCAENADGDLEGLFALPSLSAGLNYYPVGSFDNTQLPEPAANGYATVGALLVFLNAQWGSVNSPATNFVWTVTPDNITLIATGGVAGTELCVNITTIATSP